MKKKKILFLTSDKYPPFRVDVSELIGVKMVEKGFLIDWIIQSDEFINKPYQTKWAEGHVYVGTTDNGISLTCKIRKHFFDFVNDSKILSLLKNNRYNLLLIKDKFPAGLAGIVISRIYKINMVYWLSYPFAENDIYKAKEKMTKSRLLNLVKGYLKKLILYKIILPLSTHVIVQTEYMQEYISNQFNIDKSKMTPIPMGIPANKIPYWGYQDVDKSVTSKKIILYLGTVVKERKLDFLLRSFKMVKSHNDNVQLVIVGGGEEDDIELLISEAKKLQIEKNIIITGHLPQIEAWQLVKKAHLCVSPIQPSLILNCGSPTKLIEYMAMGKAVVANDHPEQRIIISESEGGLCVPYNEKAFADAILLIMNNIEEATAMGLKGRNYVLKMRNYDILSQLMAETLKFTM